MHQGVEHFRAQSGEALFKILDAAGGDDFGTFFEIEHLHGNVAFVACFLEGGRDGFEVDVAKAGTFEVGIIGVKVGEVRGSVADDVRNGLRFG